MQRTFLAASFSLICVQLTAAQSSAETDFTQAAVKKLRSFASFCVKAGYPARGREVYLEILAEYDKDDKETRTVLGYMQVGTSWQKRPGFAFPDRDQPDAAIAARIKKRWESLAKSLGESHRELAAKLEADGQADRAEYHYDRALRFAPSDTTARKARGLRNFEGFFGTERDVEILKRSRLMDREIAKQLDKSYPVEVVDTRHPILDKASLDYTTVKSKHFTVFGDHEAEVLIEAAQHAERALAFCAVAFKGYQGYPGSTRYFQYAFFKNKDDWDSIIKANKNLVGNNLEFLLKYISSTSLGTPKNGVVLTAAAQKPLVDDRIVRGVVQYYAGFRCDALIEGIGHAIVGMFFGRNLTFLLAKKQRQLTVAGNQKQKILLPDLSAWEEEARESAWAGDGTPVGKLPLVTADNFPDDGRIKSWSFCDYMMRRDPGELLALDRTKGAKTEPKVGETFAKRWKGGDVAELERSWQRFWREDTPLLRAVKSKVTPLEATSKAAVKWLATFNAERKKHQRDEVGWSADYSADCKQHADYLKANRSARGPGKEDTQQVKLTGGSNKGRAFAQLSLVSTKGSDPRKVIAKWMDWPGYRDAILNGGLDVIGLYVDKQIAVLDVIRGQVQSGSAAVLCYPNIIHRGPLAVPNQIAVTELGAEVAEFLKTKGHGKKKTIGYPLTMHFFRALPGDPATVGCIVRRNNKEIIKGVVHVGHDGLIRRTSAPGLVTFYPLEPLKKGSVYTMQWSWEGGSIPQVTFETR